MFRYNNNLVDYAKQNRRNMTPWERKLWFEFLQKYFVRIYRQKIIGNYIADFYCAKAKLIIELDGGGHYTLEQNKYDNERTKVFEKMGFSVVRICNKDVDNNFYGVCEYIDREIRNRLNNDPPVAGATAPLTGGTT